MNKGRRCSFDNELDNENNPYNVLAEQQQDDDHDYGDDDGDFGDCDQNLRNIEEDGDQSDRKQVGEQTTSVRGGVHQDLVAMMMAILVVIMAMLVVMMAICHYEKWLSDPSPIIGNACH